MIRALIDIIGTVAIIAVCGLTPLGFAVCAVWWVVTMGVTLGRGGS